MAAASGTGEASQLARWRYETLVAASSGAAWTDLVVARLATPSLDPGTEVLAAQLARAEQVIAELTCSLAAVTSAAAPPSPADVAAEPAAALTPLE